MIRQLQPFFYRCLKHSNITLPGIRMCELGNQSYELPDGKSITAKEFFTSNGVDHVSMDWNGKDGALKLDFNKPITHPGLENSFDMITNIGMTEHVENQYECYKNIHKFCKVGGCFIHMVPIFYYWADKNNLYFYYPSFFRTLSIVQSYSLLIEDITPWGKNRNQDLLSVFMIKEKDIPFMDEKEFNSIPMRRVGTRISIGGF